jgi:hypothetical protein
MLRLLVTANVVSWAQILAILMMEALCSSETLIPTRTTPRNNQKTAFFSYRRENPKFYMALTLLGSVVER